MKSESRLLIVAIVFVIALTIISCPHLSTKTTRPNVSPSRIADEKLFGPWHILPHQGTPQSPAVPPDVPMPVSTHIYAGAQVFVDGRELSNEPLALKAGQQVRIKGTVRGHQNLPREVIIDAGIGLACKASNKQGWVVVHDKYFESRGNQVSIGCEFEGDWRAPEECGEYLLLILSSAHVGFGDHPGRIADVYRVTVD